MTNILANKDIASYFSPFIPYGSIDKLSIVSKDLNYLCKKLSIIDKYNMYYKEHNNVVTFSLSIIKDICIKYKYSSKPKFLPTFLKIIGSHSFTSIINSNNIGSLYFIIAMILHSSNSNYREIIKLHKTIKNHYSTINNLTLVEIAPIISLIVKFYKSTHEKKKSYEFFKYYSEKTSDIMKISIWSISLVLMLDSNYIVSLPNILIKINKDKKKMFLDRYFSPHSYGVLPHLELLPKYFVKYFGKEFAIDLSST